MSLKQTLTFCRYQIHFCSGFSMEPVKRRQQRIVDTPYSLEISAHSNIWLAQSLWPWPSVRRQLSWAAYIAWASSPTRNNKPPNPSRTEPLRHRGYIHWLSAVRIISKPLITAWEQPVAEYRNKLTFPNHHFTGWCIGKGRQFRI